MRKALFSTLAAAAVLSAAPALAMGGGGGYGGASLPSTQGATFDDYTTAMRLIKHRDYAKAIPHLQAALAKRPRDADILNYLGYTHRMVGAGDATALRDDEFKTSLAYYQAALAIDPNHKGVHEYLGELYLQMHDLASARHEMNLLVVLCPDGCDERETLDKALTAYVPPATGTAADSSTATP